MTLKAFVVVVGGAVAFGAAAHRGAGQSRVIAQIDRDSRATFTDNSGADFDVCWGVDNDGTGTLKLKATPLCTTTNGSKLQIELTGNACDYSACFGGHFEGGIPAQCAGASWEAFTEEAKTRLVIWPIVFTERISVGASGTAFFIQRDFVDANNETIRVYRSLSDANPGTLEVCARTGGAQAQMIPANDNRDFLITVNVANGVITVGAPTPVENDPIFDALLARALGHTVRVPRPDGP